MRDGRAGRGGAVARAVFADPRSEHYRPYAAHYYGRLLRMMRLITLELAASPV
ncbi:hypothetical protein [Lentzea jiangxiensis]|uniref:hypothetical protein n=1 Tax=Lentzea jiangxiensis TaxID=641025 RepID=UPI0015A13922|nr:hypothetical protein [Lentzea jiangxiensis]